MQVAYRVYCVLIWQLLHTGKESPKRVVKTAQKLIGTQLPAVEDMYTTRWLRKTERYTNDHNHLAQLSLYCLIVLSVIV